MNSLLNNVPSAIFIETSEDSEVALMPKQTNLTMEGITKEMLITVTFKFQNNIIRQNKRIIHLLSSTVETRY
jgi:hypothetical protein